MLRHRAQSHSPHRKGELAERARSMRSQLTASEAALWAAIRGGQLGVAFRRQYVIGEFIADFAAPAVHIIVEVDGGYHGQRAVADARRDRDLTRFGYTVLHLDAGLVLAGLPVAVEQVRKAVEALRNR